MRIGIVGSGQLARMLAQSGRALGHSFVYLAESHDAAHPVEGLGDIVSIHSGEPADCLYERMDCPDVITVDSESVDASLLGELAQCCPVLPSPKAVYICQHRNREKSFLRELGIPTARFQFAQSLADVEQAVKSMDFNVIIKSCEQGYDGKNQWRITSSEGWQAFAASDLAGMELVVEQTVTFSAEVSLLGVRSLRGDVQFYPLVETRQRNGVLLSAVLAPPQLQPLQTQAELYLKKILTDLKYVGVMAMECFVVDGQLIVNELAPRVHNSGHWTQQGSATSQFENHIRAITGDKLGSVTAVGMTATLNILGRELSPSDINVPGATLHWYNKTVKPGRKVGHVNLQAASAEQLHHYLEILEQTIYPK